MKYSWRAIPETTWTTFALGFSGLAGALGVALGAPEYLNVAITAFIGASFRLVVALIGAVVSSEGTVTTGAEAVPATPIPPTP